MVDGVKPNTLNADLTEDDAYRYILLVGLTLDRIHKYGSWPLPPYTEFENYTEYEIVHEFYSILEASNFSSDIFEAQISQFSWREKMLLQGIRLTEGTIAEFFVFPSVGRLVEIATQPYNQFLTHIARARAKHAYRCQTSYWGIIQGAPKRQNAISLKYLEELIENFQWWNYFEHSKHGQVFELRDYSGHGMRWQLEKSQSLGFLEPVDPYSGRVFFASKNIL